MPHDVLILGSGCAGSTAAIYSARANLSPIVFEGLEPGGQLTMTTHVENFPGFPEGILGPDLVERMKQQAQRFGAEYRSERIVSVDLSKRPYTVVTDDNRYETRSLIVATGASARLLGLDSERALMGRGVSTCATCDGAFYRGREVAVVGGGDTALEEAIFLTRFATKVTILHRREQLRASKILVDHAQANPRIAFAWNTVITEILDTDKNEVSAIRTRNVTTGEDSIVPVDGVFVAIGHNPNTAAFGRQLELDENGYIVVHDGSKTSVPGVFAAGDVHDPIYRQAITAAGAGCRAAIDAERFLEAHES